ncbi:hypothetical protein ACQKCH_00485 [Nubsella zeaxanthinifaciens]|uniref:hypothetical protein n=1 Tax=Nubsella zeaxanthinifaciens TaxID=392412 RepID=UPI003CFF9C37
MTIVIKKKTSKKEIATILAQFENKASKKSLRNVYGIFEIKGDALAIQKTLRNEWD